MHSHIPSLSEIQNFGKESLNELLERQIADTLDTEVRLAELVERRDIAKQKAKQVAALKIGDTEGVTVETVVELVAASETLNEQLESSRARLKQLLETDAARDANEFQAKVSKMRAKLKNLHVERCAKEVVYRVYKFGCPSPTNLRMSTK